ACPPPLRISVIDLVGTALLRLCPPYEETTILLLRVLPLKLPGGAEAPEILRGDRLQGIRRDAEPFQRKSCGLCRVRDHVVAAQELDLVRRQLHRARRELQENRLQLGDTEWQRRQHALAVGDLEDELHDFAEGQHFRSAKLIDSARPRL